MTALPKLLIPTTQRQWRQTTRGLPKDCLELVQDAPVPKPQPGQVLVKISYASLTPSCWKMMGILPSFLSKGTVPEVQATGRIVDSNGESNFAVGDDVMSLVPLEQYRAGRGVLTEYALFNAELVFPVPKGFTVETSAGLMAHNGTAYQALKIVGNLQPGSRVFINGGTAACGMAGVQLAKLLGASYVAVSCSLGSFDLVRDLGADEAVDYKSSPLPTQLTKLFSDAPFDIIFDCVGSQPLFAFCPSFLKADGTFVTIAFPSGNEVSYFGKARNFAAFLGNFFQPAWLGGVPRRFVLSKTPVESHARITEPLKWAAEGKLKNCIDSVHASNREGVLAAYDRAMSERAKGKILINMEDF